MTDTADTPKPGDAPPPAGDDDTGAPPPAGDDERSGSADEGKGSISQDEARKLRSEARNLRERAKAAEAALKQREDADLSETQKVTRDLEAERAKSSQLETRVRELEVQVASAKLGVRPEGVDVVASLIDWTEVDAGDPDEVTKAIKGVLKSKPFLASNPDGLDGGRGRGAGASTSSPSDIIRRAAGR